jgi:hypothetical protein
MHRVSIHTARRISARDRQIVEHVARYRLTTVEVLRRIVIRGLSANAVSKIANRLCDSGLLQKFTLLHPTRYYLLGELGAKSLGIGTHRTIPLGPQSLPMEYAVLAYSALSKQPRKRLTSSEVRTLCPWLPAALVESPHCLDEQQQILELVRIDLGGPADHVARKCAADVNDRRRIREFDPFITGGHFRLVVVTATKEKSASIRQALDRHDWPIGLALHLSIVPQLLSLTASRHHA